MSANFRILLAVKLAFLDDNLILFVSRTPDAVTDDAVGLRELPDNPVLTPQPPARLYGRAQPNQLADFELAHRYTPLKKIRASISCPQRVSNRKSTAPSDAAA
jgi:hypothetical protein